MTGFVFFSQHKYSTSTAWFEDKDSKANKYGGTMKKGHMLTQEICYEAFPFQKVAFKSNLSIFMSPNSVLGSWFFYFIIFRKAML